LLILEVDKFEVCGLKFEVAKLLKCTYNHKRLNLIKNNKTKELQTSNHKLQTISIETLHYAITNVTRHHNSNMDCACTKLYDFP